MSLLAKDLNTVMLNTQLRRDYRPDVFWNKFMGNASKVPGTAQKWKLPGNPIAKFNDFNAMSTGNSINVTMLKKLIGDGFTGDETALSNESPMNFFNHSLFIHLKRNAMKLPSTVDMQKISWMNAAKYVRPELAAWFASYINTDITAAFLEGYSRHVTLATANSGLGVTKKYHPNFWIWDSDNTFSTNTPVFSSDDYTSATYKTAIMTKLATIENGDEFDIDTLNAIPRQCSYKQIKGFKTPDGVSYALILHSGQMESLIGSSTTTFVDNVARADVRGKDNALFNSAAMIWKNMIMYVDDVTARIAYSSSPTLDFFNYDAGSEMVTSESNINMPYEPQSVGTNQRVACAVLLGGSALGFTQYEDLSFAEESTDYNHVKGVAAEMFMGATRLDYYDAKITAASEGSATDMAKPQSAIIGTWMD